MDKYFTEPASLTKPARYCLLVGAKVVKVQASRPDGQEVPRPMGVSFDIQPRMADMAPDARKFVSMSFSRADLDRGRARAIEKSRARARR